MTLSPDVMNALFELFGSVISALSIVTLYRHKQVRGVNLWPSMFFILWGFYNIFFYGALHQPLSRVAAITMLVVNCTWFSMALYYRRTSVVTTL